MPVRSDSMNKKEPKNNQTIQMQGYLLTTQRHLLLGLIPDAEGYIDAKELYQRARTRHESIGPATVGAGR